MILRLTCNNLLAVAGHQLLKIPPALSKVMLLAGDMFKHVSPWRAFHIKTVIPHNKDPHSILSTGDKDLHSPGATAVTTVISTISNHHSQCF